MSTDDPTLLEKAANLLETFKDRQLTLTTVESCTGGLIAATLTSVSGSAAVIEMGMITYSNRAKHELVGVPEGLLAEHGAVSEPVARAMARGGLSRSGADVAIAVTGIAGPGGGSPAKPVGLVHLAAAARDGSIVHERLVFSGDRASVRAKTVAAALELVAGLLGTSA